MVDYCHYRTHVCITLVGYDRQMGSYISVLCSLSKKNEGNPKGPFPVPYVTVHFHYGGS